jgi:hypothetical protein
VAALESLPRLGSLVLAACADITDRSLQVTLHLCHLGMPFPAVRITCCATAELPGTGRRPSYCTLPTVRPGVWSTQWQKAGGGRVPYCWQLRRTYISCGRWRCRDLHMLQALPIGLSHLHLSACERLTGQGLARLSRLRSLRLSGCPAITETAVQVSTASCATLSMMSCMKSAHMNWKLIWAPEAASGVGRFIGAS